MLFSEQECCLEKCESIILKYREPKSSEMFLFVSKQCCELTKIDCSNCLESFKRQTSKSHET